MWWTEEWKAGTSKRLREMGWGGGIAQIYVTEIGMGAKKIAGAIGGNTIGLKLHEN